MNNELFTLIYSLRIYLWLIVALVFLVAELSTPGLFFFIAFAAGSCVGAVCAWYDLSFTSQALIALLSSLVTLWVLRRWFAQSSQEKQNTRMNYEALIGQTALVIKDIQPHQSGLTKVKGEVWSANTEGKTILKKETIVTIIRIEGNHLIVATRKETL